MKNMYHNVKRTRGKGDLALVYQTPDEKKDIKKFYKISNPNIADYDYKDSDRMARTIKENKSFKESMYKTWTVVNEKDATIIALYKDEEKAKSKAGSFNAITGTNNFNYRLLGEAQRYSFKSELLEKISDRLAEKKGNDYAVCKFYNYDTYERYLTGEPVDFEAPEEKRDCEAFEQLLTDKFGDNWKVVHVGDDEPVGDVVVDGEIIREYDGVRFLPGGIATYVIKKNGKIKESKSFKDRSKESQHDYLKKLIEAGYSKLTESQDWSMITGWEDLDRRGISDLLTANYGEKVTDIFRDWVSSEDYEKFPPKIWYAEGEPETATIQIDMSDGETIQLFYNFRDRGVGINFTNPRMLGGGSFCSAGYLQRSLLKISSKPNDVLFHGEKNLLGQLNEDSGEEFFQDVNGNPTM